MTPVSLLLAALTAAPAATWHKVETVKSFEGMRAEMRHLVDTDPDDKARINHLCVVVEEKPHDEPIAWVHLRERAYLFAFTAARYPPITDGSIWGGASIDLKRDVVPSDRDINGSTRRRSRAYVDRIITACARHGTSVVIEKHSG